ncbi:MAG: hypothetical protein ACK5XR_01805 [Pseudanabaena sp.]
MEPLTTGAIAIGTLILKKAFEKTGDKLGEAVSTQIGNLLNLLKKKPLAKTDAIAQAEPSADFKLAVSELETVAKNDDEVSQAILAVEAAVKADPDLLQKIQETAKAVKDEPTLIQNNAKLAEKIGLVVQGGKVEIQTFSF